MATDEAEIKTFKKRQDTAGEQGKPRHTNNIQTNFALPEFPAMLYNSIEMLILIKCTDLHTFSEQKS